MLIKARTETLTKLRKFATPTICNTTQLFDIRPSNAGFIDASIVSFFPAMPPSTLVINATGMGKDTPDSPIPDQDMLPVNGIAWEFYCRGE